ncbi:MAG: rhomboid family intramembrane serine protease [Bacteroidales bacterium]|nr:rhomboid family intramembrane serine protease [Bacteroidales bacterium]
MEQQKTDIKKIFIAFWFPAAFLIILWLIKVIEIINDISFSEYGLFPLDPKGLKGILFAPFIHGSWEHLINNSVPIVVLTWALFYFYREISFKVFLLIFFIHGFWLWFFARDAYHIGASGIIYGLGAFIFVSGFIRKNTHLIAISLLVAFLYGSMVWGVFPLVEGVSWEAHLTGMAAGTILAFYYRSYGPEPNIERWKNLPDEDEDENNFPDDFWMIEEDSQSDNSDK